MVMNAGGTTRDKHCSRESETEGGEGEKWVWCQPQSLILMAIHVAIHQSTATTLAKALVKCFVESINYFFQNMKLKYSIRMTRYVSSSE